MKQRVILVAIATCILAISSLSTTTLAQGNDNGTTSNKTTISGAVYNPCCNEWIDISGSAHITRKTTENADGSVTITTRFNSTGIRGIGRTSGINFNFIEVGRQVVTTVLPGSLPFSQDLEFTDRIVGRGRGGHECSSRVKYHFHLEIDALGNITVNLIDIEFICANGTEIE